MSNLARKRFVNENADCFQSYMTIMNDFLSENENAFDDYYSLLCKVLLFFHFFFIQQSDSVVVPVVVPDRFYSQSLDALSILHSRLTE